MILADTSAWVDYLRAADTSVRFRLRDAVASREVIVIDPVVMEVLSGTRAPLVGRVEALLDSQPSVPLEPRSDWLDAAALYRQLRQRGITVRSQADVLIATVAIRLDVPLLHRDRDFDLIAEHTPLVVEPV